MDQHKIRLPGGRQSQIHRFATGCAAGDYLRAVAQQKLGLIDAFGGHRHHDVVDNFGFQQACDSSFHKRAPVEAQERFWYTGG
jgi:hypothetical protein